MRPDERRPGLIDGTRLAREHAAEREARALRRWQLRRAGANLLYLLSAALCVVSWFVADGLAPFAAALAVACAGGLLAPEGKP